MKIEQTQPQPRKRDLLRYVILMAIIAGVVGLILYFIRENPEKIYLEGKALLDSDPRKAEQLLANSVRANDEDYPQAELLRARALGKMGRWLEALGSFGGIEDFGKCETVDLVLLAEEAHQAGNLVLANLAINAIIREEDLTDRDLKMSISIRRSLGQSAQALEQCRRLAKSSPDDPFPWDQMGQIYSESKDSPEAISAYREALHRKLSANDAIRIREAMLGQLIAVGNIPSARQELDTLLNTKRTVSLRLKEVYLLRLEGNLPLAMQVVESILVDSPSSSRAHMLRGILFFDQENYEAAVTDLKSVLESEPYNKETHYKLGQAYRNLGRENQATQHFRKSRELTEATIRIAELESQLSSDPKNNNLRSELARLYQLLEK